MNRIVLLFPAVWVSGIAMPDGVVAEWIYRLGVAGLIFLIYIIAQKRSQQYQDKRDEQYDKLVGTLMDLVEGNTAAITGLREDMKRAVVCPAVEMQRFEAAASVAAATQAAVAAAAAQSPSLLPNGRRKP